MSNQGQMPSCYTTDISAESSLDDIRHELRSCGVNDIQESYEDLPDMDERQPVAIRFTVETNDMGEVPIERKPRIKAVQDRMECGFEKALNVAWRREYYKNPTGKAHRLQPWECQNNGSAGRMAEHFRDQAGEFESGKPANLALGSGG